MFDLACLVMTQIQFSSIKKLRLDVQNTCYPLPMSDNISFLPYTPTLLKVDVILCVSPLFFVVSFSVLI